MRICCADRPIILDGELAFVCSHRDPKLVMDVFGFWVLDRGIRGNPLSVSELEFARLRPTGRSVSLDGHSSVPEYTSRKEEA